MVSLHELVAISARSHGDRLAVDGPTGRVSYAQLDARANAMAHRLRELGVGAGDRVVIWSGKSAETIAAMQAVLRLGAAYVPAGDSTPAGRVELIARDCGARVICGEAAHRVPTLFADQRDEGRELDGAERADGLPWLDIDAPLAGDAEPVHAAVAPDDLAYILYTSGSTGRPKGVCVSHANARAFVDWAVAELRLTPADRLANHAPLTFDLSVLDLYAAFAVGASVHLIPAELGYAPTDLVNFAHEHDISVWYSVPSALVLMARDGGLLDRPAPPRLRAVLFAGEPFPIDHVRALAAWTSARLLNLYGPTETNVCTFHEVRPQDLRRDRPVPIGRPASGDRVWVRTPLGEVARPGDEGELVVDGPTVMLGYWGQPRHTGPYHTGDLVRVLDDEVLDYLGRGDHLVKVRGNRVELGEVESVIGTHPAVDQVAVLLAGSGHDARLVAFVVAAPGQQPGPLAIKRHCARLLPTYMIVDQVTVLPTLPRTENGKADRTALEKLATSTRQGPPPSTSQTTTQGRRHA